MDDLERAVQSLFFYKVRGTAGGFMTTLWDAFAHADAKNTAKLALGFPAEAKALHLWNTAGDYGNDLFRQYGLVK